MKKLLFILAVLLVPLTMSAQNTWKYVLNANGGLRVGGSDHIKIDSIQLQGTYVAIYSGSDVYYALKDSVAAGETDTTNLSDSLRIAFEAIAGIEGADTTNLSDSLRIAFEALGLKADASALNVKSDTFNQTFTGTITLPATTSIGSVSNTEINYVNNVTSAIQTQLNAKANITDSITKWVTVTQMTTAISALEGLDLAEVQALIGDTMTARLAGAAEGVTVPQMTDTLDARFAAYTPPSAYDTTYLYSLITILRDSVALLNDSIVSVKEQVSENISDIESLWEAINNISEGDIVAPRFSSAEVGDYAADVLVVIMDTADIDEGEIPLSAQWTIRAGGNVWDVVDTSSINRDTVFIELTASAQPGVTYTVTYTKPTEEPYLQDSSANKTSTFTNRSVTNNMVAPYVLSAEVGDYADDTIVILMSANMDEDSIPLSAAWALEADAVAWDQVDTTLINQDTVFIVLNTVAAYGVDYTFSYTRGWPALQSASALWLLSLADSSITNNMPEPAAGNIISNGTFDSASDWAITETAWTIGSGVATYGDVFTGTLYQLDEDLTTPLKANTDYTMTFDIAGTSGGGMYFRISTWDEGGGTAVLEPFTEYTNGAKTVNFTTPANIYDGGIAFGANTAGDSGGTIDNIVLTEDE